MKLRLGAHIFSEDGEQVGMLKAVIISPESRTAIGLVLQEGLLFSSDHYLSISQVETSGPEKLILKITLPQLREQLEPGSKDTGVAPALTTAPSLIPPGIAPPPLPSDLVIPESALTLVHGTPVQTSDGKEIATIAGIYLDQEAEISHLLIQTRAVYSEAKLIPQSWIETITDNHVALNIDSMVVSQMPDCDAA
jgi:uncharacterized protein YrrD